MTASEQRPLWKRLFVPDFRSKSFKVRVVISIPLAIMLLISLVPTRLEALAREFPPVEDRSQRKPIGDACGLNRVRSPEGQCSQPQVKSVREEEVSFPSRVPEKGLVRLAGTLSLPEGPEGPRPAVILLPGSGRQTRDGTIAGDVLTSFKPPFELLRALADFFAHEGMVVLRWDKRGPQNYPSMQGHRKDYEASDVSLDALDAIAFLATRPEVNPNAIIVVGHSEGGSVAPHVANAEPRVAAVIMLAPIIDTWNTWQLENLSALRLAQGDVFGWGRLQFEQHQWRKCLGTLDTADPKERCLGSVDQRTLGSIVRYSATTQDAIFKLNVPSIAILGSVDRNIDPTTIVRLQMLMKGHDFEAHYIADLNHLLVDVIHRAERPDLAEPVKQRLRTFLSSVSANAAAPSR